MGLAGANRKAVLYGWSQGGGAVLAAAGEDAYLTQSGTAYDDLEIVGIVGLAPQDVAAVAPQGADPDKVLKTLFAPFANNVENFAHLAMTLWAAAETFPDLKLTDVFTEEGARTVDAIMRLKCVHAASDTIAYVLGDQYRTLLRAKPVNASAWLKALVASSGPQTKPVAPVVIYWGTKDVVVPPVMGQMYREHVCKLGGNVARHQLEGAQTHFSTPGAAEPLFVRWIADRFAGKPAPNGCAAKGG